MAERLETIVNDAGQKKSLSPAWKDTSHSFHKNKSIGQLKREIIALKNDCKSRELSQHIDQGQFRHQVKHSQEMLANIRVLESKVARYEHKISKRNDYIEQLRDELSVLQDKLLDAGQQVKTAQSEKEKALRRAAASEEEFESLKSSIDRDLSKIRRLQEDLDRAEILAEDLESKREKSDELYLLEKNRRIELEQRLVDSDDTMQSLKVKVDTMKNKMQAEKESFRAELDALGKLVAAAQAEALESKKYATEQAEQLLNIVSQRDEALKAISETRKSLHESKSTAEMYMHRAQLAEEAAAEATAELHKLQIISQTTASKSCNEKMHVEMESKALKEVLKSVTASAQAKDEDMARLSAMYEEEKAAWADRESQYTEKLASLQDIVHQLENTRKEERQEFERLHQDITKDRQEHLEALQELEKAHTAQLDATTCNFVQRTRDLESRQRNTDELVMAKQEEIDQLRNMHDVAETRALKAERELQDVQREMESIKQELRESQDEVEALLTVRLNEEMSKAAIKPSLHPDEQWLFTQESAGSQAQMPNICEERAHKEPKKSPIKKLAAYVRRKASPIKKPKQLNMDSHS